MKSKARSCQQHNECYVNSLDFKFVVQLTRQYAADCEEPCCLKGKHRSAYIMLPYLYVCVKWLCLFEQKRTPNNLNFQVNKTNFHLVENPSDEWFTTNETRLNIIHHDVLSQFPCNLSEQWIWNIQGNPMNESIIMIKSSFFSLEILNFILEKSCYWSDL